MVRARRTCEVKGCMISSGGKGFWSRLAARFVCWDRARIGQKGKPVYQLELGPFPPLIAAHQQPTIAGQGTKLELALFLGGACKVRWARFAGSRCDTISELAVWHRVFRRAKDTRNQSSGIRVEKPRLYAKHGH